MKVQRTDRNERCGGWTAVTRRPALRALRFGARDDSSAFGHSLVQCSPIAALGRTLAQARDRAYRAVAKIQFDGAQFRRDIAPKALGPIKA